MPPILSRLLGAAVPWRTVGLAAGALAVAVLVGWLWLRLDAVAAERDLAEAHLSTLRRVHASTLEAWQAERADHRRAMAAVSAEAADARARAARYSRIAQEVNDAPADGCVGPGVRAALRGLHEAGADHQD